MTDAPIIFLSGISTDPSIQQAPMTPLSIGQSFEATAKADTNRLEGKLAQVCTRLTGTLIVAFMAGLIACIALVRTFR